jgi:hypothetical protein
MTNSLAPEFIIGSPERLALARTIAGLVGKIARNSVIARPSAEAGKTEFLPASEFPFMRPLGQGDMTSAGVVLMTYNFCHAPEKDWQHMRALQTPFGYWLVSPGAWNNGGDVSMHPDTLKQLLEECEATDLPYNDPARDGYRRMSGDEVKFHAIRRIGDVALPEPQTIKNRGKFPGYNIMRNYEWEREWAEIARNLPEWYAAA